MGQLNRALMSRPSRTRTRAARWVLLACLLCGVFAWIAVVSPWNSRPVALEAELLQGLDRRLELPPDTVVLSSDSVARDGKAFRRWFLFSKQRVSPMEGSGFRDVSSRERVVASYLAGWAKLYGCRLGTVNRAYYGIWTDPATGQQTVRLVRVEEGDYVEVEVIGE